MRRFHSTLLIAMFLVGIGCNKGPAQDTFQADETLPTKRSNPAQLDQPPVDPDQSPKSEEPPTTVLNANQAPTTAAIDQGKRVQNDEDGLRNLDDSDDIDDLDLDLDLDEDEDFYDEAAEIYPNFNATKLIKSILVLKKTQLGSPRQIRKHLALPKNATIEWSRGSKIATLELPKQLLLRLVMADGTWEPSRGRLAQKKGAPTVIGVEISGPKTLKLNLPRTRVVNMMAGPPLYDDLRGDVSYEPHQVQVWGKTFYFYQGSKDEGWYLARYQGRSEFHYGAKAHKEIEQALIKITSYLGASDTPDLQAFMTKNFRAHKNGQDQYKFELATLKVDSGYLKVKFLVPLPLPGLTEAIHLDFMATTFANDRGQMSVPFKGKGFTMYFGSYFSDQSERGADGRGKATDVKFVDFTISSKPG